MISNKPTSTSTSTSISSTSTSTSSPVPFNNPVYNDAEIFNLLQKKYDYHSQFLEYFFAILNSLELNDRGLLLTSLTIQVKTFKIPLALLIEEKQDFISKIVQLFAPLQQETKGLIETLLSVFHFENDADSSIPNIKKAALAMGIKPKNSNQISISIFEKIYVKIRDQKRNAKAFLDKVKEKNLKLDSVDIAEAKKILKDLRNLINKGLKPVESAFFEYVYGYFNTEALKFTEIENTLLDLLELTKSQYLTVEIRELEPPGALISEGNKTPTDQARQLRSPQKSAPTQDVNIIQQNLKPKIVTEDMDPKFKTSFYLKELLQFEENLNIEYKNYFWPFNSMLINTLRKQICGFLNSVGGRIYIGINDDRIVQGIKLDSKERDTLRNEIANYAKDFYPSCRSTHIRVDFVPLKKNDENFVKNLWVVKIIIRQGDVGKLYSTTKAGFFSFKRMHGQCVTLGADEIENEIVTRLQKPSVVIDSREFEDKAPEVPYQEKSDKQFAPKNNIPVSQQNNVISANQYSNAIPINQQKTGEKDKNQKMKNIFSRIVKKISPDSKSPKQQSNPSSNSLGSANNQPVISLNQPKMTSTGVAVRGIPPDMTDENFLRLFAPFNLLPNKPIYIIRKEGKCTGQGYVNFTDFQQAAQAIEILKGYEASPNYQLSFKIQQDH